MQFENRNADLFFVGSFKSRDRPRTPVFFPCGNVTLFSFLFLFLFVFYFILFLLQRLLVVKRLLENCS